MSWYRGKTCWRADLICVQGEVKTVLEGEENPHHWVPRKVAVSWRATAAALGHSCHPASASGTRWCCWHFASSFILAKMVFLHDTVVSPRMMKCSAGIPILPGRFIPVLHRLGLGEPAAGQRLYSAPSGCLPALLSLPTPPFASWFLKFLNASNSGTYRNLCTQPLNCFLLGQNRSGSTQGVQTWHLLTTFNCFFSEKGC